MTCEDCITVAKCCGNVFPDGTCRGCDHTIIVPCPQHAMIEFARVSSVHVGTTEQGQA